MHYFDVILLSDAIWAFGPKVTRRVTYSFQVNAGKETIVVMKHSFFLKLKDARSVSLYPYNRSQILQCAK